MKEEESNNSVPQIKQEQEPEPPEPEEGAGSKHPRKSLLSRWFRVRSAMLSFLIRPSKQNVRVPVPTYSRNSPQIYLFNNRVGVGHLVLYLHIYRYRYLPYTIYNVKMALKGLLREIFELLFSVLWIRIRSDLKLFAGSGSVIINFGSGSGELQFLMTIIA